MAVMVQSLQVLARGVLRAYASDAAYQGGVLLVLAVLALTLTVFVAQHLPPAVMADAAQARWEIDPDWWP